jgi:hypothetical protein
MQPCHKETFFVHSGKRAAHAPYFQVELGFSCVIVWTVPRNSFRLLMAFRILVQFPASRLGLQCHGSKSTLISKLRATRHSHYAYSYRISGNLKFEIYRYSLRYELMTEVLVPPQNSQRRHISVVDGMTSRRPTVGYYVIPTLAAIDTFSCTWYWRTDEQAIILLCCLSLGNGSHLSDWLRLGPPRLQSRTRPGIFLIDTIVFPLILKCTPFPVQRILGSVPPVAKWPEQIWSM